MKKLPLWLKLASLAVLFVAPSISNAADKGGSPAMGETFLPAPAKTSWTGCGITGAVGYSVADHGLSLAAGGFAASLEGLSGRGVTFAAGAGCDVQMQQLVVGVFGDYSWQDIETKLTAPGLSAGIALGDQYTLGGRLGLIMGSSLVYGLVGYTTADMGDLKVNGVTALATGGDIHGWTLGGGFETPLGSPGLFWGAEYRFTNFDDRKVNVGGATISLSPDTHEARTGIKYKFGVPALLN